MRTFVRVLHSLLTDVDVAESVSNTPGNVTDVTGEVSLFEE